jgi:hypothetical protein
MMIQFEIIVILLDLSKKILVLKSNKKLSGAPRKTLFK